MNVVLKSESGKCIIFSTNADTTMLNHTIRTCYGKRHIMNWDRDTITHELEWVTYHLRRFGYLVDVEKRLVKKHIFSNVRELEVTWNRD